jgi:hypothetical protein
MRALEWTPICQRAAFDLSGNGSDHRDFQKLGGRERRQDRGEARSKHRLARSGRADHQRIVPPRGGHLERALGAFLTLDVG